MKRLSLFTAASIAAVAFALPASATPNRAIHGHVAALTATSVSVKDGKGITTTCGVGKRSPARTGVSVGDAVWMLCVHRGHHGLMLAKLRKDSGAPAAAAQETAPVKFGGVVTGLDDGSITLHDGDRDLTCSLGDGSPSLDGVKVGTHVKAACANGVLVAIVPLGPGDVGRFFVGSVVTVTADAITVQTEHGPVTCTITALSPRTASLKEGDRIGIGCRASTMELLLVRPAPAGGDGGASPAPTPPTGGVHTTLKARGTISALGDGTISVTTDGGTVSCHVGASSPSLDGLEPGDAVGIACTDGTLVAVQTTAPTTPL